MDKAFGKMTVTGTSAEDAEGTTVLSNKVFTAGPNKWVVKLNWSNYLFFLDQGYIQPTCSQAHYLEEKGDCTKIFISCDQGMILYVEKLNLGMNRLNLDIKQLILKQFFLIKIKISHHSDFIVIETDLGRGMFAAHR